MTDSVAVLSDTHGVLPALDAVLAEPAVAAADLIVVTGDIVSGPQPVELLDRLLALGDRVRLVRGNCDRVVVTVIDGDPDAAQHDMDRWAAARLAARPDLVAVLRDLPHPLTIDVEGFGPVLFCHGTPRDDEEVVLVDTRPERWLEAFAELPDEVRTVVCGHTHMPFVRRLDRRLVVNSGSTGLPYGGSGASWALLRDGAVTLGWTEYDVPAAIEAIHRAVPDYPDVAEFTDFYLRSPASDLEALRVFGPRDGR